MGHFNPTQGHSTNFHNLQLKVVLEAIQMLEMKGERRPRIQKMAMQYYMFTNNQRQEERTGKYGTPRVQYLQELVAQFQNASTEASKEKISANLANFAYDPFSYTFQRQLNVLELFFDCITEPNEKLIEFGADGICNSCVWYNKYVNYALGALYYLCNASTKEEILRPEVVDIVKRYAAAGAVSVSFSNLAQAFLDKHVPENH
ncbi:hypothetical protein Tco_0927540 [Tanacetum coccineum]